MTKSWVMSEEERLQLMKTRLTKRMVYPNTTSSSVRDAPYPQTSSSSSSLNRIPHQDHEHQPKKHDRHMSFVQHQPSGYSSSSLTAYHSNKSPKDLGSSGSTPTDSPPSISQVEALNPVRMRLLPLPLTSVDSNVRCYSPRPSTPTLKQEHEKALVPFQNKADMRNNNNKEDEEKIEISRSINPLSQYMKNNELQELTKVVSCVQSVDKQLPYGKHIPEDVMGTYKRFAERITYFLRHFTEFNQIPSATQSLVVKKNITVVALLFAASFIDHSTGKYNNVYRANKPMVTSLGFIQKILSPQTYGKLVEIIEKLKQFNIDSRMAYLMVLIIAFKDEEFTTTRQFYIRILQQYIRWKNGDAIGFEIHEEFLSMTDRLHKYTEIFQSMHLKQRPVTTSAANLNIQQKQQLAALSSQNIAEGMQTIQSMGGTGSMPGMDMNSLKQLLHGIDIDQIKQLLQGSGLEQVKQMIQSMQEQPAVVPQYILGSPLSCDGTFQNPPDHIPSPDAVSMTSFSVQDSLQSPSMYTMSPFSSSSHSSLQSPSSNQGEVTNPMLKLSSSPSCLSSGMNDSDYSSTTPLSSQTSGSPHGFMVSPKVGDLALSPSSLSLQQTYPNQMSQSFSSYQDFMDMGFQRQNMYSSPDFSQYTKNYSDFNISSGAHFPRTAYRQHPEQYPSPDLGQTPQQLYPSPGISHETPQPSMYPSPGLQLNTYTEIKQEFTDIPGSNSQSSLTHQNSPRDSNQIINSDLDMALENNLPVGDSLQFKSEIESSQCVAPEDSKFSENVLLHFPDV